MPAVRPFEERDSSQVADLHRRVFETGARWTVQLDAAYHRYFKTVFLHNPWADPALPSLVVEEPGGTITGFLGVTPQPMFFHDQPVVAAVGSQLIVDPARRSTLAGVQLLKTFLSGPQDISLADEANEYPRKIWGAFGGFAAIPPSIQWVKVFRPAEFLLSRMLKPRRAAMRPRIGWPAALAKPLCRLVDVLAAKIPENPFLGPTEPSPFEEPPLELMVSSLTKLTRKRPLRPAYDNRSLHRLLEILELHTDRGPLRKGIVRNARKEIVGWYLYFAKRGGLGEVLQMCAESNSEETVLNHLLYDASQQRVAALCGRLEPDFMDELRRKQCFLYNRGHWTLVHSRNPAILQTIRTGDAFLSRLEGEFCSHFESEAAFSGDQELANHDRVVPAHPPRTQMIASTHQGRPNGHSPLEVPERHSRH